METMHSVWENTKNSQRNETLKTQIVSETRDSLDHILSRKMLPNLSKISEKVFFVWVDGVKYYVCLIPRKYNFESGYETENKMLMDAWSIIDTSSSAWVLFVSGTMDAPYIQQVMYDRKKDQIFFQATDDAGEKAFAMVQKNMIH